MGGLYCSSMGFMVCIQWQIICCRSCKEEKEHKTYKTKSAIAVSHVALCPNKKLIWLDGRVHPNYRRSKVVTQQIRKCPIGKETMG